MAKAAKKTPIVEPKATMPDFVPGDADAAFASAGAEATAIQMVPVGNIRVMPGLNIRYTDTAAYRDKVEQYRKSIETEGFYQSKPLTGFVVREGDQDIIYVLDGHRRLAAIHAANANGAEVASVPVALKPSGTSKIDLAVALSKENTSEPNKMAENAVLVKRMLKEGLDETEIAGRLDFSERYVQDLQVLIAAPKAVRELVKRDRIAGTEAVRLLRKHKTDPVKAEAEMVGMVERAEARAKARGLDPEEAKKVRASAKDSSAGTKTGRVAAVPAEEGDDDLDSPPTGRMRQKLRVIKTHWAGDVGHRFALSEVKPFAKLLGDADWYDPDPNGTHAVLKEPIEFKATISRAAEVASGGKPVKKPSKRAQAARDAAEEEEDDAVLPGIDVTNGEPVAAEDAEPDEAEVRDLEHADL